MRQEQLGKLHQLYVSLGGLSVELETSNNLLNAHAAKNIKKAKTLYAKPELSIKVYTLSNNPL
jgi:hypothetical protein